MTVYPGATETPMMSSNRAGPELGFTREPAGAVAAAAIVGIEEDAFEVIRGGEARAKMIALNRDDPAALDKRFLISSRLSRGGPGPFGAVMLKDLGPDSIQSTSRRCCGAATSSAWITNRRMPVCISG